MMNMKPLYLACALAISGAAHAGTIQVTANAIDVADNGNCSLTEAVLRATSAIPRDACRIVPDGSTTISLYLPQNSVYSFTQGYGETNYALPEITLSAVKIVGNGSVIERAESATANFSFFTVRQYFSLDLERLTLRNGRNTISGGAIQSGGTVRVKETIFDGNTAYTGGAINSEGRLEIKNSTFKNNGAALAGASIYSHGDHDIQNNTFSNNVNVPRSSLRPDREDVNTNIYDVHIHGTTSTESKFNFNTMVLQAPTGVTGRNPSVRALSTQGYIQALMNVFQTRVNSSCRKTTTDGRTPYFAGNITTDSSCSHATFTGDYGLGPLTRSGHTESYPVLLGSPIIPRHHDQATVSACRTAPNDVLGIERPERCNAGARHFNTDDIEQYRFGHQDGNLLSLPAIQAPRIRVAQNNHRPLDLGRVPRGKNRVAWTVCSGSNQGDIEYGRLEWTSANGEYAFLAKENPNTPHPFGCNVQIQITEPLIDQAPIFRPDATTVEILVSSIDSAGNAHFGTDNGRGGLNLYHGIDDIDTDRNIVRWNHPQTGHVIRGHLRTGNSNQEATIVPNNPNDPLPRFRFPLVIETSNYNSLTSQFGPTDAESHLQSTRLFVQRFENRGSLRATDEQGNAFDFNLIPNGDHQPALERNIAYWYDSNGNPQIGFLGWTVANGSYVFLKDNNNRIVNLENGPQVGTEILIIH